MTIKLLQNAGKHLKRVNIVLKHIHHMWLWQNKFQSSHREVFLRKGVLKNAACKFTREHACRKMISIKLICNFIEITLRHGSSPVNLLHIFRTYFSKNTPGWLLLNIHVDAANWRRKRQQIAIFGCHLSRWLFYLDLSITAMSVTW